MMWITFNQDQTVVQVSHIVSARVQGNEKRCQVIFKDILGDEYRSDYCKSFAEAEGILRSFMEATEE